ncbi:ATP-binding protein [Pseudodesulfovibrio methanolicus]|uniref:ATP-binding protein n=1 Tax=Pseudodesulfovibrio methanolicus TaxID=3126690 RepID=A0ABZ2J395_9BACT
MKMTMQEAGVQSQKISGQEESARLIPAECLLHGTFLGHQSQDGRIECPKCAANKAKRDALETGIPFRFIAKSWNDFVTSRAEHETALNTAKGYAENFDEALQEGAGLVFLGKVGTGKTHLACAIANHIRANGRKVLYSTVRHAVGSIKNTWSRDSHVSEAEVLGKFFAPDLLILDEVGVQFGSEADRIVLYDIIDGRYGRVRPTIIASNLSLDGLQRAIGLRSMDRMREKGQLILFNWKSHRQ